MDQIRQPEKSSNMLQTLMSASEKLGATAVADRHAVWLCALWQHLSVDSRPILELGRSSQSDAFLALGEEELTDRASELILDTAFFPATIFFTDALNRAELPDRFLSTSLAFSWSDAFGEFCNSWI